MNGACSENYHTTDVVQWLQKTFIEVPGNVSVMAKDVYTEYCKYTSSINAKNVLPKFQLGQIVTKIFGEMKVLKIHGSTKYSGLRQNFLDNRPYSETEVLNAASKYEFFQMNSPLSSPLKLGHSTGFCSNKNEVMKVIEINADKSWKLSVSGRVVNLEEIGLTGLKFETEFSTRIIFNTVKQIDICRGKTVQNKTDTNKFSVVQEWFRLGDENNFHLSATAKRCHAVLPITAKSTTCKACNNQKVQTDDPTTDGNSSTECGDAEDVYKKLFPEESDLMLKFIKLQSEMSTSDKDSRGRRWDKDILQVCLTLWNRSPQGYSTIRSSGMFIMPSESLLQRYKNCLQQTPGINEEMFSWMYSEAAKLKVEKNGGLIIDEMSVQEDLKMSFKDGKVSMDGLVNTGQLSEDMYVLNNHQADTRTATHVMQLIFLSYDGFRFPIAYYPTVGANAADIYVMVWEVINKLNEYDFMVDYVCFDGSSNNRAFQFMHFKDMANAKEKNFTATNPYYPSQTVTLMMDYSHNIKKLRNNIHSSGDNIGCTRKLVKNEQFIIWGYWIQAYTWDRKFNTPIRIHQKLTDEHIFITTTSKMRNHLAEQVLDSDMLNLMVQYQRSLHDGSYLNQTIKLLEHTSKVIALFRDCRPIADVNDQRLAHISEFETWLLEWSSSTGSSQDLTASAKAKQFISKETYSDLVSMNHGFVHVCKKRIKSSSRSVTPAGINSDVVENFFCQQRTICNGSNSNPSVHQYKYGINATILGQNAISNKSNVGVKRKYVQPYNFTTPKPLTKRKGITF